MKPTNQKPEPRPAPVFWLPIGDARTLGTKREWTGDALFLLVLIALVVFVLLIS
jgi:hypothetical protein